MNRREFLKKTLEGIVLGSIPLISSCSKNPVESEPGIIYVVKTIHNLPIEDFAQKYSDDEFPLEIKLENYKPDAKLKGSVRFNHLGWQKIENYPDYTGNPKN